MARYEDDRMPMIMQELVRRSNDESRRLRDLETRLQNVEERATNLENLSIEKARKLSDKLTEMELTIRHMSDEIAKLENAIERINKQVVKFARKRDIREIEKMFDLLSPIKQEFVTRHELEEELRK